MIEGDYGENPQKMVPKEKYIEYFKKNPYLTPSPYVPELIASSNTDRNH